MDIQNEDFSPRNEFVFYSFIYLWLLLLKRKTV